MRQDILSRLKPQRPELVSILERHGHEAIQDYATSLYQYFPSFPLEPILLQAFEEEWSRVGMSLEQQKALKKKMLEQRVLQTATHLTASEGPTFLAIHALSLLGISPHQPYGVACFSGIPFSNNAWPGCLNYGSSLKLEDLMDPAHPSFHAFRKADHDRSRDTSEHRLSLIPSTWRDALVYRSPPSESLIHSFPYFSEKLQQRLPPPHPDESYALWALKSGQAITRAALGSESPVFFDLNEVITGYLIRVLSSPEHPISELLFEEKQRQLILNQFSNEILFYQPLLQNQRERVIALSVQGGFLQGGGISHRLEPASLQDALCFQRLCPAPFLTFLILVFLNGFKCLGSFQQVEYLADYKRKFLDLGWPHAPGIESTETDGLTCGRLFDEEQSAVFPLDVALGRSLIFSSQQSLWDWMTPILSKMLQK